MSKRTKGIVAYLAIAFGLAWLLWEIMLRLGGFAGTSLSQIAILPGAFAPAIAAIVVRKWVTGEGFSNAGMRPHLRQNWKYYLIGLFLPFVVTSIIVGLAIITGAGKPNFDLQNIIAMLAPGAEINPSAVSFLWILLPMQLTWSALLTAPILWGEEFGWRGYLQPRLFPGRPLMAAVVTGIIWGVWHYPLNLRGYNYPEHPLLGLLIFPVSCILISIIFGWLMTRSTSIWTVCLAHSATNAIGGSLTLLLFMGRADFLFTGYLGLLSWIPLGALAAWIVLTGRLKAIEIDTKVYSLSPDS